MQVFRRVGTLLLSGLLCAALVPVASLSFVQQAWADSATVYAMYYRTPGTYNYTLVIQKGDKVDSRYGTFIEKHDGVVEDTRYNWGDEEYPDWEDVCECGSWGSSLDSNVTKVIVKDAVAPHRISFEDFTRCASMDLVKLDTSKMTSMRYMFASCQTLKSLNLSQFNTSNVTDMHGMFAWCDDLESVNLTSFNTARVNDMSYLFSGCESLKSINVSSFNTASVTDMSNMFSGCDMLASLDLSKFNMNRVLKMNSMLPDYASQLAWVKLPASANFRGQLPIPTPEYVDGAVGTWVNSAGKVFKSSEIPGFKADTYKAKRGYSIKNGDLNYPQDKKGNSICEFAYTGKAVKPKFKVKVAGKTLVKNRDYTISFKSNTKVGTAKVIVKGKGNYSGKLTREFSIVPPKTSIKKVKGVKKGIKVTWKRASSKAIKNKQVTGYSFKVTTDKKGEKGVWYWHIDRNRGEQHYWDVKGAKKTTCTIKGLKSKKKYYVFVRAERSIGGHWSGSEWSKPKAVRTK